MCNYWTNFIKKGDPNGKDADGTDMPFWPKYNDAGKNLQFFDEVSLAEDGMDDTMKTIVSENMDFYKNR